MKLFTVVATALMLVACSKSDPPPAPVRPVLSVVVKPAATPALGRFAGTIQARYSSTLGFRVAGRIAKRNVDVGSAVEAGAVLAVLDPTDQQNALRASEGDQARLQAQWINAQANAHRQQALFDQGVGAQAQLDSAQTDLRTATASLDQAKASVNQARDQLSYGELRADHAAVITDWQVDAGQVVSAGQGVVTLARPESKEAVLDLPTALAEQLPANATFQVAAQLEPQVTTTATLRELEPQADASTRTRRARLTLVEPPASLRLGTSIIVTVDSAPVDTANVDTAAVVHSELPSSAIRRVDGMPQVWIVDPATQTVQLRKIQIISERNGIVAVGSGLQNGERVVSAGVNSLSVGQKVKIDKDSRQ